MSLYMPIIGTGLALRMDKLNERQAQINHSQTLERLADRGGLSPSEALAVMERRAFTNIPESVALIKIMELTRR